MKFRKITIIEIDSLSEENLKELQVFSEKPIHIYAGTPSGDEELLHWIDDSDCLLVNFSITLNKDIFDKALCLKYVGVFAAALSRIDLDAAVEKGIAVRNIVNWCDKETAEWVIAAILTIFRGLNVNQWSNAPQTLSGKTLGIIGLGRVGMELARFAFAMGMRVVYHNRKEKAEAKVMDIEYLSLPELLKLSDVISIHLPPDSRIMGRKEFVLTRKRSLLVNTSVGETIDIEAFEEWLEEPGHFAVFDRIAGEELKLTKEHPNILIFPVDAYLTPGVEERRVLRLIDNVKAFLEKRT